MILTLAPLPDPADLRSDSVALRKITMSLFLVYRVSNFKFRYYGASVLFTVFRYLF